LLRKARKNEGSCGCHLNSKLDRHGIDVTNPKKLLQVYKPPLVEDKGLYFTIH